MLAVSNWRALGWAPRTNVFRVHSCHSAARRSSAGQRGTAIVRHCFCSSGAGFFQSQLVQILLVFWCAPHPGRHFYQCFSIKRILDECAILYFKKWLFKLLGHFIFITILILAYLTLTPFLFKFGKFAWKSKSLAEGRQWISASINRTFIAVGTFDDGAKGLFWRDSARRSRSVAQIVAVGGESRLQYHIHWSPYFM